MAPALADARAVPRALRASPGFLLSKAAQRAAELAEQSLKPLALKTRHYGVLVALQELGPLSQHELGQLLRIDRTTMVAVVDHLERLGCVRRGLQPGDRRAYQVQLTPAGQAALDQARSTLAVADAELVDRLSPDERSALLALLGKLCDVG
jgi:MarR family transcriptional regulator, lower aerobic nicotinate degradation pathway regulator